MADQAQSPEPLVKSEVDLRNFAYMPLHVLRLRDSDFAAESSGDEFKAAVLLWCAAWHQVPAGSLPDSDKVLAKLAGIPLSTWQTIKEACLRGFVKCSDGRLYHPLISENATKSWNEKVKQKQRTEKATKVRVEAAFERDVGRDEKRYDDRYESRDVGRDVQRDEDRYEDRDVQRREQSRDVTPHNVTFTKGEGEGIEKRQREEEKQKAIPAPDGTGPVQGELVQPPSVVTPLPTPRRRPPRPDEPTAGSRVFESYAEAYQRAYGFPPVRDAKTNAQCKTLAERLGAEEAPPIAAWFVDHRDPLYVKASHPLDLLLRDYQRVRTEWLRRGLNGSGGHDPKPRGVVV